MEIGTEISQKVKVSKDGCFCLVLNTLLTVLLCSVSNINILLVFYYV